MLAILGVLVAFPLKRRFINDEQLPFPEGRAAGIVMDDLHSSKGQEGLFKSKILAVSAGVSALVEALSDEALTAFLGLRSISIPEYWDNFIYKYYVPKIMGTPLRELTISLESSIVMVAAGGLMGINTGLSLMVGACANYLLLAPMMIQNGIIEGTGFKSITMWSLWGGVAMMTTSFFVFFFLQAYADIVRIQRRVGWKRRKTRHFAAYRASYLGIRGGHSPYRGNHGPARPARSSG